MSNNLEVKSDECLTLAESQQASLKVLIKFDEICKAQGFRYYLIYGTLIGAIRHNGFIPWDDDIDVMMPREDFDKFVKYAMDHSKELYPFKIHTRANTKDYFYGIPRFSDMTYKYISTDNWGKDFDIGVFIDVYPWDNYGTTREDGEKLWNSVFKKNVGYKRYLLGKNKTDNILKAAVRRGMYLWARITKGKDYNKKIDAEIREYILANTSDSDKCFGHLAWAQGIRQFEKSKLMDLKAIPHEFAGHTFDIPAAYDYLLTTSYKDYMQLPPEKDRHPTHDYKIIKR